MRTTIQIVHKLIVHYKKGLFWSYHFFQNNLSNDKYKRIALFFHFSWYVAAWRFVLLSYIFFKKKFWELTHSTPFRFLKKLLIFESYHEELPPTITKIWKKYQQHITNWKISATTQYTLGMLPWMFSWVHWNTSE